MKAANTLHCLQGWRITPAEPMGLFECALIVPTYRRPREIVRLLNAISELPDMPGEVVIVDGSPDNDAATAIQRWAVARTPQFTLSYVKSPPGLTRQRNVGIDACNREFVFFLDDDCLPEPGYFRSIRQVFLDDKQREIGGIRGFLTNGIQKPLTKLWRIRFALGLVPKAEPGRYHPSCTSGTWDMVRPFSGIRPVDVLAGGASAYRREVFTRHRFSEFFYGYAQGEDLEMSLRIGKEWKLVVCGDARVNHDHAESGRPAGIPRGRMAIRNRYFIWKRHSPMTSFLNRFRFWADHALSVVYYFAGFILRPWHVYFLGYAIGTVFGAMECIVSPPFYEEPLAKREYAFYLEEFSLKRISKNLSCSV